MKANRQLHALNDIHVIWIGIIAHHKRLQRDQNVCSLHKPDISRA